MKANIVQDYVAANPHKWHKTRQLGRLCAIAPKTPSIVCVCSNQSLNGEAKCLRGDKSKYTSKQKRKAEHIEEGYRENGVSEEETERRACPAERKKQVPLALYLQGLTWRSTKETEMATKLKYESIEVRKRAAEIRRNWSPLETIRRTGLPPDTPTRLRQFILGEARPEWSAAVCGRIGGAGDPRRS